MYRAPRTHQQPLQYMQTCFAHRKTRILFLWDYFCFAQVWLVSVCQMGWCKTTWFTWDLPFAFVTICVGGFGWRQGFYLCIWLLHPALYSNALIWHTHLYSVSHYAFLIKTKFPGFFLAVLGVGILSFLLSVFFFCPQEATLVGLTPGFH